MDNQNHAGDVFLLHYFLNNLLLTVFMKNTLSELLKIKQTNKQTNKKKMINNSKLLALKISKRFIDIINK